MALDARGILSLQITDGAGKTASLPVYFGYDSGVETLSSLSAAAAILVDDIDAIIDGQVTKMTLSLDLALPGSGIKTSPVAGSNVQETGLFTYPVLDTPYAHGIALPSIAAAVQDQGIIPNAGAVATFNTRVSNAGTSMTFVEPISLKGLDDVLKAVVTFRKHR